MHVYRTKRRSRLKDKFLVVVLITLICLVIASPFVLDVANGFLRENTAAAFDFSKSLNNIAGKSGFLPHQAGEWALPYIIGNIISAGLVLLGVVFLIIAIIAGYRWMMAGGNEETVANAKSTLSRATIGVFIVLVSYAIVYYVIEALL